MSANILTIISGGQTGVDLAGLDAAMALDLKVGGHVPFFYDIDKVEYYKLVRMKETYSPAQAYVARTIKNIEVSDGTAVFKFKDSRGTDGTIRYAHYGQWKPSLKRRMEYDAGPYKPYLVISSLDEESQDQLREFIISNNISILNVAGHRDMEYYEPVKEFLIQALQGL